MRACARALMFEVKKGKNASNAWFRGNPIVKRQSNFSSSHNMNTLYSKAVNKWWKLIHYSIIAFPFQRRRSLYLSCWFHSIHLLWLGRCTPRTLSCTIIFHKRYVINERYGMLVSTQTLRRETYYANSWMSAINLFSSLAWHIYCAVCETTI